MATGASMMAAGCGADRVSRMFAEGLLGNENAGSRVSFSVNRHVPGSESLFPDGRQLT